MTDPDSEMIRRGRELYINKQFKATVAIGAALRAFREIGANDVKPWEEPPEDAVYLRAGGEFMFGPSELERSTVETLISESTWDETAHTCWLDLGQGEDLYLGSRTLITANKHLLSVRDTARRLCPDVAKMLLDVDLLGRDVEAVALKVFVPSKLLDS